MSEGFIESIIKRKTRNLLISAIVLVALSVLGLIAENKAIGNILHGPSEMTYETLSKDLDSKGMQSISNDYITIEGIENFYTGLQLVETRDKTETVLAEYYYLDLGEKYIIVEAQADTLINNKVTGTIAEVPTGLMNNARASAIEEGLTEDEFNAAVMPIMLNTTDLNSGGQRMLFYVAILLGVAIGCFFLASIRSGDIERHPIFKKLSEFGEPRFVADNINQEMRSDAHACFQSLAISDSWLLNETIYGLKMFRLNDLVWFYKMTTKHRLNFIIPLGKTHQLMCALRTMKYFSSSNLNEKKLNDAISYISSKIPWAFSGFDAEIQKIWEKQPGQIIASVDQRKIEYQAVQVENEPTKVK